MLSPSSAPPRRPADVCLIIEGAYPYVQGGVSSWTHDLIATQCHLTFHLLVIVAPNADLTLRYTLPPNVCGLTQVFAGQLPAGQRWLLLPDDFVAKLHRHTSLLMTRGDAEHLRDLIALLAPFRQRLGARQLLDSAAAWQAFCALYQSDCSGASFLNAFWGWRTLVSGLLSAVLMDVPPARVYHAISTGYAGLLAARATMEAGRPSLVTEHGVYTNERRLEILAAPWLAVDDSTSVSIDGALNKVKDLWINTFVAYSRACYQSCAHVVTLFEGNHLLQLEDGAQRERLCVIPNGISLNKYAGIVKEPRGGRHGRRRPTIALVGRVVPIKDIKTYIRACALLVRQVPDVLCYVLGPKEEEPDYATACEALVAQLGLQETVMFTGMANLLKYLGKIDIVVLTSISEAQPLVMLEAGAAGVPSVATDVGACREMVYGRGDEVPRLGCAGRITPIGNPPATANAIAELLLNEPERKRCGDIMRERVERYYDLSRLHARYAQLYAELIAQPDAVAKGMV